MKYIQLVESDRDNDIERSSCENSPSEMNKKRHLFSLSSQNKVADGNEVFEERSFEKEKSNSSLRKEDINFEESRGVKLENKSSYFYKIEIEDLKNKLKSSNRFEEKVLNPIDLIIMDKTGILFNSLEIYGLGANEKNELSSKNSFSSGCEYLEEECSVCLTDPKEIVLLPCRYISFFP